MEICRHRAGVYEQARQRHPPPVDTSDALLSLNQPTTTRNRAGSSYVDIGGLNDSRDINFPGRGGRRSFEEFVGLGVMCDIPAATTVAFFRGRLHKADEIEEPFEMFKEYLRDQDLKASGGK